MERYQITLKGVSPLLHHHDNLTWDAVMKKWASDPSNKAASVAGDDRSPAFRWIGYLYHYANKAVIPSDNLMTMFREGGAKCPTGKRQGTFKSLTQCGIMVDQAQWDMHSSLTGKPYLLEGLEALKGELDYEVHQEWAVKNGFELFEKRAKVGQAKHVRVRPRFDNWGASGSVTIMEPSITQDVLQNILTFAGAYSGLCDWRPSSPKSPGIFGRFEATVRRMK